MSSVVAKSELCKRDIVYILLILVFAFMIRINFFHEPFERDEGLYGAIAQEILAGGLPYVNGIENKPPIIYYIYSGMVALLGNDVFGIRVVTALFSLLTLLAVFQLAGRIFDKRGAFFAAILYSFYSSGPAIRGTSSQCEVFMLLPLLLAAIFLIDCINGRTRWKALLAGTMMGTALLVKTTALPFVLFFILYFFAHEVKNKRYKICYDLFLLLSPIAGLVLIFVAYFAFHNALNEFIYWNYTYQLLSNTVSFTEKSLRFINRVEEVSMEHLPLWLMVVPSVIYFLRKRDWSGHRLLALALIPISLMAVFLPNRIWPHYFILLVPSLVIVAGGGLSVLSRTRINGKYFCGLLIVLVVGFSFIKNYGYYVTWSPYEISRSKYNTDLFASSEKIASYIKDNTLSEDLIFQWGWQPELYFLSGRRSPNQFQSVIFAFGGPGLYDDFTELLNSIVVRRPKYIIVQAGRDSWPGYDEFMAIVNTRYAFEKKIDYGVIYRRLATK